MINELRNLKPFVHFGFNRTSIDAFVGEEVTIYQDTIYNEDYNFTFNNGGGSVLSESKNEIKVKYNTVANFDISFDVIKPDLTIIESEPLVVSTRIITADTNRITADSNTVTADGSFI